MNFDIKIDLIMRKVQKNNTDCWIWTGRRNRDGYGIISRMVNGKVKTLNLNRVLWEFYNTSFPNGLYACHKCDIPSCCNPNHIFPGTQKQNMKDASEKNRMPSGENSVNSKLTESQVREIIKLAENKENKYRDIANKFGVSRGTIVSIFRGTTWVRITGLKPTLRTRGRRVLSESDIRILNWIIENTKSSNQELANIFNVKIDTIARRRGKLLKCQL